MSAAAKKAWETRRKRHALWGRCPKCGRATTKDRDGRRIEWNCPVHGRVAIYP